MIALLAALAVATFTNPVYNRDFPDPFVLQAGSTYYAYATNGAGEQVQTATSHDFLHWSAGPDALPKLGKWAYPGSTWAPSVLRRRDGTYVLYYTASRGTQCIGRAVAPSPLGPFVDRWSKPLVCQRGLGGSIDPSPFRDADGSLYLYWKNDGNSIGRPTEIWAQRLSPDGTRLLGAPHKTGETNDRVWEGHVVEGPTMWRHGGRYYLFYSGGNYADDTYGVGYATCTGPFGPCKDARENPILHTRCRAHGPGGESIIVVRGQAWMVYHAWLPNHAGDKRVLWIDRLDWLTGPPVVHGPTCTPQPTP
jgi:beta-xylosidase